MGNAMKNKVQRIAASILSADFSRLGEEVQTVVRAGADWIHVDVMDGHFVPNITIGPPVVASLSKISRLPLDVHLMIENADRYIDAFAQAGANWMSVHQEACPHLSNTLAHIRELGVHPGVALNPSTPLSTIHAVLDRVEYVLVMSVNPGFAGQTFIPHVLTKIRDLVQYREEKGLKFLIEIDGGINLCTIGEALSVGTDVFVAGSAIFGSRDYAATIREMRQKINS